MGGIQGRLNQQFALTIAISVLISAFNALIAVAGALGAAAAAAQGVARAARPLLRRLQPRLRQATQRLRRRLRLPDPQGGCSRVVILVGFALLAGGLGKTAAHQLPPRRGPGLLLPQRAAPRRRVAAAHGRGLPQDRGDPGADQGRAVLQHGRRLQPALRTCRRRTTASSSSRSSRGTSARAPGCRPRSIVDRAERRVPRRDPGGDARSPSCRRPSPASARRAASRSGCRTAAAARSTSSTRTSRRSSRRRASGRSSRNVNSTFRAAVPQVFVDVDRDKALKQGVPIADVYQTLQAFLGGTFVNQFNRFGRQWRVFLQAEGDVPHAAPRTSATSTSATTTATWCRSRRSSRSRTHHRARVHARASTCSAPPQVTGAAAPGYSSGQAMAALEEVAQQTLPREMGYDWADLSYQEKKAAGSAGAVFALSLVLRLPDPGRALRELVAAVQRAALGADRGLRRLPRPAARASFDLDVYGADRPRHADRPRRQERDPDRRVRQGRAREGAQTSSTPRWRARGCACGRS